LTAKFRNDSNFLVRDIRRGKDVEERSLEMTEVSRPTGRWKKVTETGIQSAYILEYSHHLRLRRHFIPDSHTPWYTSSCVIQYWTCNH